MNRYVDYKTTETDWLGRIPSHWEETEFKRLVGVNPSKSASGFDSGSEVEATFLEMDSITETGEYDASTRAPVSDLWGRFTYFERGDVLVAKITPCFENGKGADVSDLPTKIGFGTTELHVLRPRDTIDAGFLGYIVRSHPFRSWGAAFMKGSAGQQRVPVSFIKSFPVGLPPLSEQRALASYLDQQTDHIAEYIAKKRKLVDLLKTQRRAVVNRAVTKGLDDDVAMQDSGVEWLGEIPAHWEQVRLKYLAESVIDAEHKTAPAHSDGDYLVVRTSNIRDGRLILDDVYYTNEEGFREWTQRGIPQPGDILFTREAPAGEACLVPEDIDLCLGQRVVCIKVDEERLAPSFAMRVLNSSLTDEFIKVTSRGATVDHFNMSDIGKIPFLVPPHPEQKRIVEHIDAKTADIDAAIERTEQQIALMRQYRTSLVAEVVTGAVDVREEVAA